MFQIRTFREIAQSMLNFAVGSTNKITNYVVGGVARTAMEAAAMEVAQLYQDTAHGVSEAIETMIYTTFGFGRLQPAAASNLVTFTSQVGPCAAVTIYAGTLVGVPNTSKLYGLVATTTLPAAASGVTSSVSGLVLCTQKGTLGNTPAGTVTSLVTANAGVASVTNTQPFQNGRDLETPDDRRARFQGFIQTLQRGTLTALTAGVHTAALTDAVGNVTEQVQQATTVELIGGGGVTVYVHNGTGNTSAALVAQAVSVVQGYTDSNGILQPGYKAAGMPTTVLAAADQYVTVSVNVSNYLAPGFTLALVINDVTNAVRRVFTYNTVGGTLVLSDLQAAVRSVQGVYDCAISSPTANLSPSAGVNPQSIGVPSGGVLLLPNPVGGIVVN
ncbi:MAG TPA: baseplate J/gp47 family protein [Chloroflexota bacterium]|jgi:uncharacterized phage protein gp47/JayE